MSGRLAKTKGRSLHLQPDFYQSSLADFDLWLERFDIAGRLFALRGLFEWRISAVASVLVDPGSTVFEAGAHYGTETLYYGWLVGANGRVVSFEADQGLARRLTQQVERLDMKQCVVMSKALGDEIGEAFFEPALTGANSGLGSLAAGNDSEQGIERVEVTTLDESMDSFGSPGL